MKEGEKRQLRLIPPSWDHSSTDLRMVPYNQSFKLLLDPNLLSLQDCLRFMVQEQRKEEGKKEVSVLSISITISPSHSLNQN